MSHETIIVNCDWDYGHSSGCKTPVTVGGLLYELYGILWAYTTQYICDCHNQLREFQISALSALSEYSRL